MISRKHLLWWLIDITIVIIMGLTCLPSATARAPRYSIGDTVSVGSGMGEYDLDGDCLKLDATGDPDTYLCPSAADEVTLTCGAAAVWVCNASGCDLAGELGSVTSLDATTLATITAALSSGGFGDDVPVSWGDSDDFHCEWDTDGAPDGWRCTHTDCDGLGGDCDPLSIYENGSGQIVADLKVDSVTNSAAKVTIGAPAASTWSLGANTLHVTGATEFDGTARFDGTLRVETTSNGLFIGGTQVRFYAGGTGHLVMEDGSTGGPVQIRGTDGQFTVGASKGGLGCVAQTFAYDDFTDDGGASGHLDLDDQIPIGSDVQKMILYSLTGFTGDTTAALTVGDSGGVDVDRYHSAGTLDVVASAAAGVDCGAPSGTTWHVAAITVRLVLTGAADFGNFSAGEATISICYWTP